MEISTPATPVISTNPRAPTSGSMSSSSTMSDQVLYRPPRFRLEDDPMDWLEEFSQAVVINEWDDKRAVALAIALMHNTAQKIFRALKITKYADFETAFREKYHQNHYKERAYAQAQAFKQAPDEDVEILTAKMTKLFERAGITEDSVKRALYKRAANRFIYSKIIRKNPATFEEMIEVATQADLLRRAEEQHDEPLVDHPEYEPDRSPERRQPSSAQPPAPPRTRVVTTPEKVESKPIAEQNVSVDDLITMLGRLSLADANVVLAAMGAAPTNRAGPSQPPRIATQARSPVVCYRCNEPGHYSKNCVAPAPVPSKQINWVEVTEPELVTEEDVNAVTRSQSRNAAKTNVHPYQEAPVSKSAVKIRAPRDSVIKLEPQEHGPMNEPQAPEPQRVNPRLQQ
ncbi:hypothetical protein BGZ72_002821 [Mortierella alpina]|nr:hypothetical protein BGZ72_002821 [Mortierella alpina]